eukprot:TRINITY_DN16683_c0_g1_i1.p1 TRINITY_DN16683_c0_g1~~TRINITY_DN16683_c0_g1_i1.p1  ORF type:complete len:106 (-),score=9.43 TRINITY_DN16683_c0_g1_i1:13-330(-)
MQWQQVHEHQVNGQNNGVESTLCKCSSFFLFPSLNSYLQLLADHFQKNKILNLYTTSNYLNFSNSLRKCGYTHPVMYWVFTWFQTISGRSLCREDHPSQQKLGTL